MYFLRRNWIIRAATRRLSRTKRETPALIAFQWVSHGLRSRNWMMLPGGRACSGRPHRLSWRQSNIGAAPMFNRRGIAEAFWPSNTSLATSAEARAV